MIVRCADEGVDVGGAVMPVVTGTNVELAEFLDSRFPGQWGIVPNVHVRQVLSAFHLVTRKRFRSKRVSDDATLVVRHK